MNLKTKVIHGLTWSFTSQVGTVGSQFIITVILARLLSPSDFGLLGMITVFTGFATIFNDMGISGALIQKQDTDEKHLSSAFWLNIIIGVILTLLMMAASPLIARFYDVPQLEPLIIGMSLNYFIASFTIVQQAILTKDMDFKRLAARDIVAVIAGGLVGITLAYRGFGVWSLVYQSITFTLMNVILLWTVSPWRPKFIFSKEAILDIFKFSANLTGFSIVNFFGRNVDYLLIGKFLGAEALGFYTLAYKLMMVPLQNISWVISRVMFPAYSKIQNNLIKLGDTYLKTVKAVSLVTFPMMFILFVVAPEFVVFIFGPQWEPTVIIIRVLCICGAMQSIGVLSSTIYQSLNETRTQFRLQLAATLIVTVAVIAGLNFGIKGVALFYTLQYLIWFNINYFVVLKLLNLKLRNLYANLKTAFTINAILILILFLIKPLLILSQFFVLSSIAVIATAVYLALLIIAKEIVFENNKIMLRFLR
jgi:Membrane protein involved in the export of O-antigen and teichoic acid